MGKKQITRSFQTAPQDRWANRARLFGVKNMCAGNWLDQFEEIKMPTIRFSPSIRLLVLVAVILVALPGLARAQDDEWTCDEGPNDVLNAAQAAFDTGDLDLAYDLANKASEVCASNRGNSRVRRFGCPIGSVPERVYTERGKTYFPFSTES
jgi:hypothetical protein